MREVTENEVKNRLRFDNPWWESGRQYDSGYPIRRTYFDRFYGLATQKELNRAVVLMGPRRVGKTVLLRQTVQQLIVDGVEPQAILYVSVDQPLYSGLGLEKLLNLFIEARYHRRDRHLIVMFDEIQYLTDWEIHLKSLVDSYPWMRFIASGSAAAALRMRSRESGAGRFRDFLLPPLTFKEYCDFRGVPDPLAESELALEAPYERINSEFVNYINFGGFPEAALSDPVRADFQSFIGRDIIDKVLLRDLPALYGIHDTRELYRFFAFLAYNSGEEVSFERLSQASGVAKNTLRKYLEYLEAAFLIKRVSRLNRNARRYQRETHFKIYLTNPSLRAALYGPVEADDPAMGKLVETAVFSQWAHTHGIDNIFYARWQGGQGEVDLVHLDKATRKPSRVVEIKWSDRIVRHPEELKSLFDFVKSANTPERDDIQIIVLTRSSFKQRELFGQTVWFVPASLDCYFTGVFGIEAILQKGYHPRTLEQLVARLPCAN